ncbi:MAG: hypothetical protein Roseis2KO_17570 [Roseivirga sp.]
MHIKPLKTLLIVLLFLPLATFAQKQGGEYYSGYIVNNSGDTIPGQLLKSNQYLRPETIVFTLNGEPQQFNQFDIRAFYIDELDLLFESHTITKNQDSNTLSPIEGELTGTELKDKHFLLTIAKTETAGIYAYLEENGMERLYYRTGQQIEELLIFRTLTYENGVQIPQEKTRFRIQLLGFFIGCDNLQKKINSTLYNRNSLKSVFLSYAKCKGEKVIYKPKISRLILNFGASVGAGTFISADQSETNFVGLGAENARIANSSHQGGGWFEAGLAMRARLTRNSLVALKGELKFRSLNIETAWQRPIPVQNILSKVIYNYDNTNLMFNFLVNLNFVQWENGHLYFEGGISLVESLSQKAKLSSGIFVGGDEFTFTDTTTDDIVILDNDIEFIMGLGVEINNLSFSLRYSFNAGANINDQTRIAMSHSSFSLNALYNFR